MRAAIDERLPENIPDTQAHCLAAGLIARRCSVAEAVLASVAKEIRDLFGPGDAEWRDLKADAAGIRCARHSLTDQQLSGCCRDFKGK